MMQILFTRIITYLYNDCYSVVLPIKSFYTKGIKPGHIPSAKNIPYGTVVDKTAGTLKSPEELKEMFVSSGIDLEQPLVASCGSGKCYMTHLSLYVSVVCKIY